jgi:hypothetical protein
MRCETELVLAKEIRAELCRLTTAGIGALDFRRVGSGFPHLRHFSTNASSQSPIKKPPEGRSEHRDRCIVCWPASEDYSPSWLGPAPSLVCKVLGPRSGLSTSEPFEFDGS